MGWFAIFAIRVLESMFIVGGIGSAIVLVLTAIEDMETLLGMDESSHADS
jgi:hypothetical protein